MAINHHQFHSFNKGHHALATPNCSVAVNSMQRYDGMCPSHNAICQALTPAVIFSPFIRTIIFLAFSVPFHATEHSKDQGLPKSVPKARVHYNVQISTPTPPTTSFDWLVWLLADPTTTTSPASATPLYSSATSSVLSVPIRQTLTR